MTISVENLSVSFNTAGKQINAIDKLSFSITSGETFALLGESGCGKSLTASAIMQLLPKNAFCHKASNIYFKGDNLLSLSESEMRFYRGNKIAMIFQEPMTSLNPVLTIGEQLGEVLLNTELKLSITEVRKRSIDLLETVEILEAKHRIDDYPHQFSGGQIQRIMIAMAIGSKPELLIADEPTTALDVTVQAQVLLLLKRLTKKMGMAMLLITHDLSIVKQISDKVGVMYAGQLVELCQTEHFFKKAKHPYSKRLLNCIPSLEKRSYQLEPILGIVPNLEDMGKGCRFKPRCKIATNACLEPIVLQENAGHQMACSLYENDSKSSAPPLMIKKMFKGNKREVLKVSKFKIHYPIYKGLLKREVDRVKAVDDVSFTLFKGETLALVGESGCGKTTLSRGICQLLPITSGRVFLDGTPIKGHSQKLTSQLQIIFQDPFSSMNPRMLVSDILLEGLYAKNKKCSLEKSTNKINYLLDMVGLPKNSAHRYPHEFSGGQRQRISIARALAVEPSIIICDEPTSALDVSVQSQLLNLLLALQSELGLSYLFISHDLAVVSYMADKIMVMKNGKIVETGKTNEIIMTPKHHYTKELMKAVATV